MRRITQHLLKYSRTEKDVENAYRAEIVHFQPDAEISSPYHTDGYAKWGTVRLLLEAKYDELLKERVPLCNVLGQLILYLKHFEQSGEPLPNVLFVGDKNECFVLGTSAVQGFLSLAIDWTVAPSQGSPELTRALVEGLNLLPYVYDVDDNLNFREVLNQVEILAKGELSAIRATPENIEAMFYYWQGKVFTDSKLAATEQVDVFLRCLFSPADVYLHPAKKNVLIMPGYPAGVLVNADQYKSFFSHFQQGYKPSEVERFYAMKDRLVEDEARRRQGAFFTPKIWADCAHKRIEEVLGENWRQECLVWNPACGTANLTRDYVFSDLMLSTLEQADVNVILEQGYNPGAKVFQMDFLNDEIPLEVQEKLRRAAAEGRRLVFLMNPPYGTANNAGTTEGDHKAGIALTVANLEMKKAKLGACSSQLYAQFFFRCQRVIEEYSFKQATVATFSLHTFMCSGSFRPFRDWWYKQFAYKGGFLFNASHFADVSSRWGVAFTIWNYPGTTHSKEEQPIEIIDLENFQSVVRYTKPVYNSDDREASKWVREPIKSLRGEDAPQMSSGLSVRDAGRCLLATDSMFYMASPGNGLQWSGTGTCLMSSAYSNEHGLSVLPVNFNRCIALYAARKLVPEDWINQKDEYLVPDVTLPGYGQWVADAHVYALLHTSNNCTAMRQVPYKGNLWDIKNHFFWRTRDSALAALDTAETPALYRDCKTEKLRLRSQFTTGVNTDPWALDGDPYLGYLLESGEITLSSDALHVINLLDDLWLKSLPHRENYAAGKPELHLTCWDCSTYQCKHIFRDLFPVEWLELRVAFKALAERLKPGVYDFGFLRR